MKTQKMQAKNRLSEKKITEIEKTARAKARAAAAASTISISTGQQAQTERYNAKMQNQQLQNQLSALINGNQNNYNAAKPDDSQSNDSTGSKYTPNNWS